MTKGTIIDGIATNIDTTKFDDLYDKVNKRRSKNSLSPSALNTGLQCRRKYSFQYIKGWKVKSKSLALALGTSLHAATEHLNRSKALDKECDLQDMFAEFDAWWEEETEDLEMGIDYRYPGEPDKNKKMGNLLIEKYWNSKRRKQMEPMLYTPPGADVYVPAVEMPIEVPFINVNTGKFIDEDWTIIGYIDVIKKVTKGTRTDGLKKGDVAVLDYKTTAREFSDFKLATLIQLLIYSYGMRYMLRNENMFDDIKKDQEDYVGIIELLKRATPDKAHARTKMIQVTDENIEFVQNLIKDFIEDIKSRRFLPNFGDHCMWCDFKQPCMMMNNGQDPDVWWNKNKKKIESKYKRRTVG